MELSARTDRARWLAITAAAVVLTLAGCKDEAYRIAKLEPTQGNIAKGEVRFYKVDGGVRVIGRIEGLTPGVHGFHLHEKGDCSAPDATSAGAHYNPAGAPHGPPTADRAGRHVGDLGNVEAGPDGIARYDRVDPILVYEDLNGLSVLVHQGKDDFTTPPSGNSGARIACGVIREP